MIRTLVRSPLVSRWTTRSFQTSRPVGLCGSLVHLEGKKRVAIPHTHTHGGAPCTGHHAPPVHTHTHGGAPCTGHTHGEAQSVGEPQTIGQLKVDKPSLMIAFTCKKCDTRSSHTMSKQSYTSGTVLIQCPQCKVRHLIADHLKIFSDKRITIQDILSAQGDSVSTSTADLAFEDIPKKLQALIGHHAKDAPNAVSPGTGPVPALGEKKKPSAEEDN